MLCVFPLLHHENSYGETDSEEQSIYWGSSKWDSGAKGNSVNNCWLLNGIKRFVWNLVYHYSTGRISDMWWGLGSWHPSSLVLHPGGPAHNTSVWAACESGYEVVSEGSFCGCCIEFCYVDFPLMCYDSGCLQTSRESRKKSSVYVLTDPRISLRSRRTLTSCFSSGRSDSVLLFVLVTLLFLTPSSVWPHQGWSVPSRVWRLIL